jgi:hypothetical protein
MKKKVSKKKKPVKQKIDVVIESLVHLEQRVKELIDKVKDLHTQRYYHPQDAEPKKYWPNTEEPPFKYTGITWNYND